MAELSKERLEIIVNLCEGLDGEDMEFIIQELAMDDQMRTQLHNTNEDNRRLDFIQEDTRAGCELFNIAVEQIKISKMHIDHAMKKMNEVNTHLGNIEQASDRHETIEGWTSSKR
jgi:hypothetical protein